MQYCGITLKNNEHLIKPYIEYSLLKYNNFKICTNNNKIFKY